MLSTRNATKLAIALLCHHGRRHEQEAGKVGHTLVCFVLIAYVLGATVYSQPIVYLRRQAHVEVVAVAVASAYKAVVVLVAATEIILHLVATSTNVERVLCCGNVLVHGQVHPVCIWIVVGLAAVLEPSYLLGCISLVFASGRIAVVHGLVKKLGILGRADEVGQICRCLYAHHSAVGYRHAFLLALLGCDEHNTIGCTRTVD